MFPRRIEITRYPLFDVMRLFLAVEVVVVHILAYERIPISHMPVNAVPAFVGISGFLILQSFERSSSWLHFAWKRVIRVGPAFIVSYVMLWLLFGYSQIVPTLVNYATAGIIHQGKNGPQWTLMVEEVLYVSMAILASIGAYKARWPIWTWAVAGVCLFPLLMQFGEYSARVLPLVSCFPIGSLMYLYRDALRRVPWAVWGVCLVLAPFISVSDPWRFELWNVLGTLGVVGLGAFGPKLIKLKADLSYGVYIYHALILNALHATTMSNWWTIPVTLAVATASWYLIEKPCLRLKDYRARWALRIRNRPVVVPLTHRVENSR